MLIQNGARRGREAALFPRAQRPQHESQPVPTLSRGQSRGCGGLQSADHSPAPGLSLPSVVPPHHGMSYNNPPGRFSSALSPGPGLYGSAAHGLGIHPGAGRGVAAPQGPGYYPAPHPSRVLQGPPQHAHMSSDRHSPGAWNNLGMPPTPKSPAGLEAPAGPGNPLFSLQMLVNQDMGRAPRPPQQHESVDLSAGPIALTRNGVAPLNGEVGSAPPVSVIAQTPPRERLKSVATAPWTAGEPSRDDKVTVPEKREATFEAVKPAAEEESGNATMGLTVKQSEESMSVSSPSASSPVQSPKCGNLKRAKKVDSIVETLVESGAKKSAVNTESVETGATVPVTASVIVSPVVASEDSSGAPGLGETPREDDVVSPSFSDDLEDRPRRKRKLDKPVRMSKTVSDAESEGPEARVPELFEEMAGKEEQPSQEKEEPSQEKEENEKEIKDKEEEGEEEDEDEREYEEEEEEERSLPTTAEPVSARGMDTVPKNLIRLEKLEVVRRRRSSESSSQLVHQGPPFSVQKTRRKSESDQQDDAGGGLAGLAPEQGRGSGESKFIEVETELEKMFAGIEEDTKMDTEEDPLKLDSGSPVLVAIVPEAKPFRGLAECNAVPPDGSAPPGTLKRVRSRTPKRGSRRFSESLMSSVSSADSTPQKKKRKQQKLLEDSLSSAHSKKRKQTRLFQGGGRETAGYDSSASGGRSRGPVVHLEGPRDNPCRVTVVNAPRNDEEEAGDRRQPLSAARRHNDLEFRGKASGAGMFSSTLSARYDSQTADCSWICVFCKHGPHAGSLGLGDLFGPYLIGRDRRETREGSADDRDIAEEQRRGGKGKHSLRGTHTLEQFHHRMSKKVKRGQLQGQEPVAAGLVPVGGDDCWEVWVHEECVVWAGGVYLVGSRVAGLQEAVWSAVSTVCNKCGQGGANVGCVRRGCEWRMHVVCARQHAWQLDHHVYVARCHQHKIRASSPESILPT
ncbi:transcription factor 20-like isoform X2 [Bacillus rossius redtenbacheri]|uniref:transcription factor 20-like isoform X2 n=1 Tax=Bacillus rossius redtenbacheri TaxID=93214 RepID=UPI002FDDFDBD